MRKTTLGIALAAALGTSIALAQSSPGADRQPSGAPAAGDTRTIPGPDTRPGHPRVGDPSPDAPATSVDRQQQPAGAPNAGDTRAIPNDPARANRDDPTRANPQRRSAPTSSWRERYFGWVPAPTTQPSDSNMTPYGSTTGHGAYVDPLKV
jgi:hypothetical protein